MHNFKNPGKYCLNVKGSQPLIHAWSLKYGQHFLPTIQTVEKNHYLVIVDINSESEVHEIVNSINSMLLTVNQLEFLLEENKLH